MKDELETILELAIGLDRWQIGVWWIKAKKIFDNKLASACRVSVVVRVRVSRSFCPFD
jgi:hypothetical protein